MFYPKKIFYKNFVFMVPRHVYEPAEDSFLLLENLDLNPQDIVLDMGTGCGIIGIIAAEKVKSVVAVDINPYAVRCAKKNAKINGMASKIDIRLGNLFEPIEKNERFSAILFNAPYLPVRDSKPDGWIEKAWNGGKNGRQVIDRFINEAPSFLTKNGRIFLVQSSLSNIEETLQQFHEKRFRATILSERNFMFERIVVIRASFAKFFDKEKQDK